MVEPVFGDIRYIQGLNRFRRKGHAGVRLEFFVHVAAHNLRRVVAAAFFIYLFRCYRYQRMMYGLSPS